MVVMGVWAFILCTGHRWRKTKEQQPLNNTKQIFHEQKTKKSFALRYLCPIHEVLSAILEPTNFFTNCQFIWTGKVYIWLSVCLSKTIPLANMSQKLTRSSMLRIKKLINFNMTCLMWTFQQIHSCMGICFSCMYTNNCEHFRINDLVLFTRIIQRAGYRIFNNHHKHNSPQLHP